MSSITTTAPIRIAIVDDHKVLLDMFPIWISNATDRVETAVTASSWGDLLTSQDFENIDVVLLDVDLNDRIPLSLKVKTLTQFGARTVLFSAMAHADVIVEAMEAGAYGYVTKTEPAEVIVNTLIGAMADERYVSEELRRAMEVDKAGFHRPKLSDQERRVMALFSSGEPMKRVADELGVTEGTAKGYLKSARMKYRAAGIDVGDKVSLRKQAVAEGLIRGIQPGVVYA